MYHYRDISLFEALSHIDEQAKDNRDFVTTIGAFVGGMIAPNKVQAEEGVITISKEGFSQLVSDRLGSTAAAFNQPFSESTKLLMLHDLAQNKSKDEIKVRISESKNGGGR